MANNINPVPLRTPILSKSATFKNAANSAQRTPTPTNPLINDSVSILPNDLTTKLKIPTAAANIIKLVPHLAKSFELEDINFAEPTKIPQRPAILRRPLPISSQSNSERLFIAADNIRIATDKPMRLPKTPLLNKFFIPSAGVLILF